MCCFDCVVPPIVLQGVKPLGQVLVNRMQGAVPLGEKNNFHCFAIKMRYDTSVVLGSHTKTVSWDRDREMALCRVTQFPHMRGRAS